MVFELSLTKSVIGELKFLAIDSMNGKKISMSPIPIRF